MVKSKTCFFVEPETFVIVRSRIRLLIFIRLTTERDNLMRLYAWSLPYRFPPSPNTVDLDGAFSSFRVSHNKCLRINTSSSIRSLTTDFEQQLHLEEVTQLRLTHAIRMYEATIKLLMNQTNLKANDDVVDVRFGKKLVIKLVRNW